MLHQEEKLPAPVHTREVSDGTSSKEPTCQCKRCKRHRFDPCQFFLMWTILIVFIEFVTILLWGFPGGTVVKNPPANAGDTRDEVSILSPWSRIWQPWNFLAWKILWTEELGGRESMR